MENINSTKKNCHKTFSCFSTNSIEKRETAEKKKKKPNPYHPQLSIASQPWWQYAFIISNSYNRVKYLGCVWIFNPSHEERKYYFLQVYLPWEFDIISHSSAMRHIYASLSQFPHFYATSFMFVFSDPSYNIFLKKYKKLSKMDDLRA